MRVCVCAVRCAVHANGEIKMKMKTKHANAIKSASVRIFFVYCAIVWNGFSQVIR